MNDNTKKWLPWALAGACLLLLPCAFCGGWLIPRGQNPKAAVSPDEKAAASGAVADEKPKANPVSKARDEWGFQDIQDHLAANGVKTSRGSGTWRNKAGMWFMAGDGKAIDAGTIDMLGLVNSRWVPMSPEEEAAQVKASYADLPKKEQKQREAASLARIAYWKAFEADLFFVEDHSTVSEAKRHVEKLADVDQEQATAWSKYVIYSSPEKRAKLSKLLP